MDNTQPTLNPQPIMDTQGGIAPRKKKTPWVWIIGGIGLCVVVVILSAVLWYRQALRPIDAADTTPHTVEIVSGMTPQLIGAALQEQGLIRSEFAFALHTRMSSVRHLLQAGIYEFRKDQSTQQIVDGLVTGPEVEEIEVTFLPGGTAAEAKKSLVAVGFSETEIDEAFSAQYDHPLFAGRPATADIEGYLYGETHRFIKGSSLETILTRFFDDFYKIIEENDLEKMYAQQDLSLYEGITLASIVQRESGGGDEAQIAQVFLLRLKEGIQLGSDVTYQYIADKLQIPRAVNLDNPYNTRRYTGLPPGPIATPGNTALLAVAKPAAGDYIYFLSGDDDVTYFAHTEAEHEENIRKHCQQKCQII